ncbi:MFS transporter [Nocardia crassostreae]|uniref:MFS transporter n=1 Tax=Nocardia crassostreae TaxID=53428 RepID=UPI00082C9210|nr:MFS transporter [Nocardia crassostreae]
MNAPAPAVRPNGVLAVLAAAGILAALMQTLVVPLIGDLPRLLHTSAADASWAITATLLSAAVATPIAGRLGDMYGKRRMLLASTVPLIAGSVLCAVAGSVTPMIIGRGLQGLGMGIVPLGISAMRDLLPPERLGSAIAVMSASMGIGGALGLPLAAAVAQHTNWHVLFWGAAVVCALIAGLIWVFIPTTGNASPTARFDVPGALGLGAGLVCLLLAMTKGAGWGWTGAMTLGLFAAAVVLLIAWVRWELYTTDPLVDLRVTARPQVLLTNVVGLVLGFAVYAQSLLVPQLLQLPEATGYGLGQSMLGMGLWMAPSGLVMMAVSPLGARLSAARGPRTTLIIGSLVIAAGYASGLLLMGSAWGLLVLTCVCAAGIGLAYGTLPALIMGAVPLSETAAANSFNTLMRSIGSSIAAAVVGVVLSQLTIQFGSYALPSETGFRVGLLIGCAAAVLAAAVTVAIPARAATTRDKTTKELQPS